jgi:hypothetical protein
MRAEFDDHRLIDRVRVLESRCRFQSALLCVMVLLLLLKFGLASLLSSRAHARAPNKRVIEADSIILIGPDGIPLSSVFICGHFFSVSPCLRVEFSPTKHASPAS